MVKPGEMKTAARVACPLCGHETVLAVEPGTNVYVCPGCGSVNLVFVDANLEVRQVRHAEKTDVIEEPVLHFGNLILDEDLAPLVPDTLRPYLNQVRLLLKGGGRPERIRGDVLLALETLRKLGMVRER